MKLKYRPRNSQQNQNNRSSYLYYKSAQNGSKGSESKEQGRVGKHLRLLPAYIAISVIVLSILFSLTLSSVPVVDTLDDQASPYREINEYSQATSEIMEQSLANQLKLSVDTKKIETELLSRFPELRSVALRLPILGRKPTLVLDFRQPALILSTNSQTFAVDNSGIAVSEIRNLSSEYRQGVPAILDQSGLELGLGKQALTTETVTFIYEVIEQLKAKNLSVNQLTLPVSINELDIRIEGIPFFVKTDTSLDARTQVGAFLATMDHLSRQGIMPNEYIDVRVEERAFYK